ncbi:MAG TPA: hypothetical protein VEL74_05755 [Thermoanaerobaculia bacterium]|nr:hypothetical protein [Thermoanaerobaculia bacterium]
MPGKLFRFLIAASLVFCALFVSTAAGSAQTGLVRPGPHGAPHGALFLSYTGACGGWVRDADNDVYCCDLDERPTCDDEGSCECSDDDYCEKLCKPAGTCDQRGPVCPEEEE